MRIIGPTFINIKNIRNVVPDLEKMLIKKPAG